MANLERHFQESPYHYCAQCGRRRQLAEMIWQEGALICSESSWCNDAAGLIGSSEAEINRKLRNQGQEMQPDPKLQNPAAATSGIEDIIL